MSEGKEPHFGSLTGDSGQTGHGGVNRVAGLGK